MGERYLVRGDGGSASSKSVVNSVKKEVIAVVTNKDPSTESEDFRLVREAMDVVRPNLCMDFSLADKDLIRKEFQSKGGDVDENLNWIIHEFYESFVKSFWANIINKGLESGNISKRKEKDNIPFDDILACFKEYNPEKKEINISQTSKEFKKMIRDIYIKYSCHRILQVTV